MHSAPSVTYPVRPSHRARWLALGLWAAGAACVGTWCWQAEAADALELRHGLGLASLLLSAALAWWASLRAARDDRHGELHWDGQYWSLDAAHPVDTVQATVHLDFQSLLLVRLSVRRSVRWLWLDRCANPLRWRDLRRALFARPASADARADAAGAPLASSL